MEPGCLENPLTELWSETFRLILINGYHFPAIPIKKQHLKKIIIETIISIAQNYSLKISLSLLTLLVVVVVLIFTL